MKRNRVVYALLSVGLIGAFFGHGMWAVDGKDSFVELFAGTFDNVFGVTVSTAAATSWVQVIGWVDIAITVVLVVMFIGNLRARGALYEFAYSKAALVIYAWGAVWGFLTAGARVTAAGEFYPEVWDVVERAPNFLLPVALVYLVYQHRLDHSAEALTAKDITTTNK
jgi:hypothetical protein